MSSANLVDAVGNPLGGAPRATLGRTRVRALVRGLLSGIGVMPRRALILFTALVLAASGCLQRSLPVPPPSVTSQSVTECPASECPDGGVVVTFVGEAFPAAEVIVQDLNPATVGPLGEVLGGVARADASGAWRFVLGPQRDLPSGRVRAPRRGDTVSVFQVTAPPDSEVSGVREVVIGR